MKIKLYSFASTFFFFNFISIIKKETYELYFSSIKNIKNNFNILAIVNNTKNNMGLVIIGMIVVILGLIGYTFLKNK